MRDYEKVQWCWDNDIIIYPIVWREAIKVNPPNCKIQVNYQGYKQTGEIKWSQKNKKSVEAMYNKIKSLYLDYYDRKHS